MKTSIRWEKREIPLDPFALTSKGRAAVNLLRKILKYSDKRLKTFKGGAFNDLIFLLCENSDDIPWVDGVQYYGFDDEAQSLLIPTHSRPNVNTELLESAFKLEGSASYILCPDKKLLLSTNSALPLNRDLIDRWIEKRGDL